MSSLGMDLLAALESKIHDDKDQAHLGQSNLSNAVENDNSTFLKDFQANGTKQQEVPESNQARKREVFHYQTPWLVSCLAWCNQPVESLQLAVCSYIEQYLNKVTIIALDRDAFEEEIYEVSTFDHPYPPTKLLWSPEETSLNLLATTADYLRLWRVVNPQDQHAIQNEREENEPSGNTSFYNKQVKLESLLNQNSAQNYCAPLTSLDWNRYDPRVIVTSSVDTTCAIWDIETSQLTGLIDQVGSTRLTASLRSQVLAHNHEVYDVSFLCDTRDIFVSSGGDGSIRLFDLRKLDTSTIVYEVDNLSSSTSKALVRVACNKKDSNYISLMRLESNEILLLDLRNPGKSAAILNSHSANVNSMSWAPHSAHHICSASNDQQALIWQLSKLPAPIDEPLLAYKANGNINATEWSDAHSDWIGIGYGNSVELLRV